VEGATRVERERLTAEIAGEYRLKEAKQKEDAELADDRDKILEGEVLALKDKFKNQDLPGNECSMITRNGWISY